MILNYWGEIKDNIRIKELNLEIRNLTQDDEEYREDVLTDIHDNFLSDQDFSDYLRNFDILIDRDNCVESFLSNIVIMDLIPDDEIFMESSICKINNGFPFLFCEEMMDERILKLIRFMGDSDVPPMCELYANNLNGFKSKFGFFQEINPLMRINDFDELFVKKIRNIFDRIDNFLMEDSKNYYTLDLIMDAIQSLEKNQGTKQALLPCFSIIERTVIVKDFRKEIENLHPYVSNLSISSKTSSIGYLDDVFQMRSKLIHGEYSLFYERLDIIHKRYFEYNVWDYSEYTPLNWCLNYIVSDMTRICSSILHSKFVEGSIEFCRKKT